jgi:hypothetical protein
MTINDPHVNTNDATKPVRKSFKYYDFLLASFVTVLLCSNLIGAGKAAQIELPWIGTMIFGAGNLVFSNFLRFWRYYDRGLWLCL